MMRRFGAGLILMLLSVAYPAISEVLPAQPDFTFRRVSVPQAGASQRITVQIQPVTSNTAPLAAMPASAPVPGATPLIGETEWFWNAISPALADMNPGRLEPAVAQINAAPEGQMITPPRLQALQVIAQAHGINILRQTVGTSVSPALVLAVIAVESGGDSRAVSKAGAMGLMQLMPDTAARFGVDDGFDVSENIRGGVAYLDWLMEKFDRDPILVLAAYNAGEGNVRDNDGVPPFAETRAYVPKVLAAWQVTRAMCITPPELISDGCVFSVTGG